MKIRTIPIGIIVAFILLGSLVSNKMLLEFDITITNLVQSLSSRELDYFFSSLTFLGSTEATIIFALIVTRILSSKGYKKVAISFLFFLFLSFPILYFLKHWLPQTPPGPQFHRSLFPFFLLNLKTPYSFPSGHTTWVTFVLGFVLYPISNHRRFFLTPLIIQVFFLLLILLVGYSRIYLGKHWASDVVGGYLLAGLLLLLVTNTVKK